MECTGGAVTPIKCRMCLTTESSGRVEAPVINSTPAVAQVVPVKNNGDSPTRIISHGTSFTFIKCVIL